jgi:endonuclease YncB( thermonuclease family)
MRRLLHATVLIVLLLLSLFTAMEYYAAVDDAGPPEDGVESAAPAPLDAPPVASPRRDIDPGLFSQPFAVEPGGLTRIAPREPEAGQDERPDERHAEGSPRALLHRPLAVDAGNLTFDGRPLRLSGIEPTGADQLCPSSGGAQWPCGMMARTAFRNFLRGRSLECDIPQDEWPETATATCTLGESDVAAWLVSNGWADAAESSPYSELAEEAAEAGRGIHGTDPR